MFGITAGFDVVIGNPPYIQLQKDGGRLGDLYEPCNFDTFTRTGDIYCLFYEKANQLSKKGGHVCYITSNKWMRTGYGKKLRNYFIENIQPLQLMDTGPDVFDATVDTNILLLRNTAPNVRLTFTATTIKSDFDAHTGDIAQYLKDHGIAMKLPAKGEAWTILSSTELALKRKIEKVGKPLRDWDININRGITTGRNKAFVIDETKREALIAQDPRSAEIIKPLLRGQDIKLHHVHWAGLYLISTFPSLNLNIDDYPAVKNYLLDFGRDRLEQTGEKLADGTKSRKKTQHKWFELQDQIAYYPEFAKPKVVWKRIGSILRFAYSQHPMFCLDSTCIATGEKVQFLTAVLNSRLSHYQLFGTAPKTGTGDLIVSVQALEPFFVPPITKTNQHLVTQIEEKVDKILAAKDTNPDTDVFKLEKQIDQIVYLLYNLTPEEIAIVEEAENV